MGGFSRIFSKRASLESFDLIISVNHAPAIAHLDRLGLSGRSVFVDSLLVWRAGAEPITMPPGLRAYLVQDYPGAGALIARGNYGAIGLTAPLVWPHVGKVASTRREGVTLHLGGMTSPIAKWEKLAPGVLQIVREVGDLARSSGEKLTVMGNGRLRELPPVAPDVVVLGVVSPAESARLIASSKLVVTTPGIGAVYEALMHGTVVVLLVPKKRTQLHHYKVLTGLGIAGAVPPRLMTRLAAAAANVDWARQTLRCLRVLKDFPEPILSQLTAIGQPLLQASVDSAVRERYLGMQGKLLRMLSQADPVGVLRTLVLP